MQFFKGTSEETKECLDDWPPGPWHSLQENSLGETTSLRSPASRLERIVQWSRTPKGLGVVSILWVLFLVGLVFVSIQRMSWGTPARAGAASSTAASLSERNWDVLMDRRPFCCQHPLYADWNLYFLEGRSSLKYEIHEEVICSSS